MAKTAHSGRTEWKSYCSLKTVTRLHFYPLVSLKSHTELLTEKCFSEFYNSFRLIEISSPIGKEEALEQGRVGWSGRDSEVRAGQQSRLPLAGIGGCYTLKTGQVLQADACLFAAKTRVNTFATDYCKHTALAKDDYATELRIYQR